MHVIIKDLFNDFHFNGQTPFELYKEIKPKLAKKILGVAVNGELVDWQSQIQEGSTIEFLDFEDPLGKYIFWHSSAHILAQAVLRHFPDAKPSIGPPIEEGFYYDFADLYFSEHDFEKIEKEVNKIIAENLKIMRIDFSSPEEATLKFKDNKYKLELIEEFKPKLSAYQQGNFIDLCRGPHLLSTGVVKSFKLLKTSAAFWRGDAKGDKFTRIYGISFPDKTRLRSYLDLKEAALKRDHRVLGQKHDLFSFQAEAPGMPFIHPSGMIIWQELIKFWKELHDEYEYLEIKTPGMMKRLLWEKSGHWNNYLENMYLTHIDDEDYAIKPMNCPGSCLFFHTNQYSYRQLPIRIAEIGTVYRHELSGVLSGLFRVRCFHQDDSHLFMTEEDIETEVQKVIELSAKIYSQFGLEWFLELSTKPDNYIGSDESWEFATLALKNVLDRTKKDYRINHGDGAFYGPKIDIHIKDTLNRSWQCGTIQLDNNLPERFNINYVAKDSSKKRPIMVHRTIFGSIERFLGILIEHYAARFPLWLSPKQVRLLPISSNHLQYAQDIHNKLTSHNLRSEVDNTQESLSKKIRQAQVQQVNYILVVGDKEVAENNLAVRSRESNANVTMHVDEVSKLLIKEYTTRSNSSLLAAR